MKTDTLLITGATGRTGRRLTARLAPNGQPNPGITVREASRRGDPPFAWDRPETWDRHLSGAQAVFACYAPDVADPEAPEILGAFAGAATAHGVARLVLQSGRGDHAASPSEEAVRAGFPAAVVVRSAWFQQDFSEHFLYPQVLQGRLRVPVDPAVGEPFVDLEDSAEALATLLTDDAAYQAAVEGSAAALEFTGPESLTFGQVAGLLSAHLGRTVRHEPTAPEQFIANAADFGLTPAEAEGFVWLFAEVMNGSVSHVTPDLEQVLGRKPRAMSDYISRTAGAGTWLATVPAAGQGAWR